MHFIDETHVSHLSFPLNYVLVGEPSVYTSLNETLTLPRPERNIRKTGNILVLIFFSSGVLNDLIRARCTVVSTEFSSVSAKRSSRSG